MSEEKELEIVAASQKKTHRLPAFSPRQKLLILGVALLLAVSSWGIFSYVQSQKNSEKKAYQTVVDQYRKFQENSQHSEARAALQQYLATNPKNKAYRADAEYYLANVWGSLGDNKSARESAEAALKDMDNPPYSIYLFLADACKMLNDKSAAIKYYQLAIDKLKPQVKGTPGLQAYVTYAKNNIESLKESKK